MDADAPYGCSNQPRPWKGSPLRMQSGWTDDGRRRMVEVTYRMAVECQYDLRTSDVRCKGCCHADA